MDKIYLVGGRAGSYADYHEWPVGAYESEEEAKQLVCALDIEARTFGSMENVYRPLIEYHFKNAGFPEECIPYCGSLEQLCYTVQEVPFNPAGKL